MDLYKILDVLKGATDEEIKKSYRNKSKIHHPDKGGNAELFNQITIAYKILLDSDKRTRYDSGENIESLRRDQASLENQILKQLVELFTQVVYSTPDPKYSDIVEHMVAHLNNNLNQIEESIKVEKIKIERLEIVVNRIKKSEGENIFVGSAQAQIINIKLCIANFEMKKLHNERALKMLEDYSYQTDQAPVQFFGGQTWSTTASGF